MAPSRKRRATPDVETPRKRRRPSIGAAEYNFEPGHEESAAEFIKGDMTVSLSLCLCLSHSLTLCVCVCVCLVSPCMSASVDAAQLRAGPRAVSCRVHQRCVCVSVLSGVCVSVLSACLCCLLSCLPPWMLSFSQSTSLGLCELSCLSLSLLLCLSISLPCLCLCLCWNSCCVCFILNRVASPSLSLFT